MRIRKTTKEKETKRGRERIDTNKNNKKWKVREKRIEGKKKQKSKGIRKREKR